jgi:nitric oxide reductase NorE protein
MTHPPIDADGSGTAARIPGEPGVWIVIVGDIAVFSMLFGVYLYSRADSPELFAKSQAELSLGFGLANTLVMLTSSLAVVAGVQAARASRVELARRAFAGAVTLGLVFVALKAIEWGAKIDAGLVPSTNDFFMLYYVLTGVHLGHVVIGVLVLAALRAFAIKRDFTGGSRLLVESGAVFWHMVDLIWLVLFPLVYLAHSS